MSTRVFALIVGIDNYKSGGIWNLHGCTEDAKKIRHWLTNTFDVPKDQIRLLLDKQATKHRIEEAFMEHLITNPSIERGDAILVYFAGHGSSLRAPSDWFQSNSMSGLVQTLCPYDHDVKTAEGRISGISDRSLQAMIDDLSASKGDNITLLLDTCFSPTQNAAYSRDRSIVRYTLTSKATPEDLYRDLWPGARGKTHASKRGFFSPDAKTHTTIIASSSTGRASEDKTGGLFTDAFLHAAQELPLHQTTYAQLMDHISEESAETQQPCCLGANKNRIIFDAVPFTADRRLSLASLDHDTRLLRIQVGDIHGVVQGTELSLHFHNRQHSYNPPFALVIVTEVGATWSFARVKTQGVDIPKAAFAKITRWNNRRPFRVHLKTTFLSFIRMWKIRTQISTEAGHTTSSSGLHIVRVKQANLADITLSMGRKEAVVVQHNPPLLDSEQTTVKIHKTDGMEVIDDAARFNLHLLHKNPSSPLRNLIDIELYQIDKSTWTKLGVNNIHDSTATIPYQSGAVYQVVLRNNSQTDLWPYLAYLDPNRYRMSMLYHPDGSVKEPPLRRRATLEIGSGQSGSEALSFTLSDDNKHDYGYLKLFLSSTPVDMRILENGQDSQWIDELEFGGVRSPTSKSPTWDTILTSLVFVRHQNDILI
ncbi:caspase domain-containing protein [Crepidotus variabilis]|uniref:Caspase domain-containing protein n=1 Tax=Crepidotus variabilis TaxID=179855 RepID=A0A9P6EHZ9_9AGAR|nr:caspase domain-containing protein [Crepidotus variabilis]